MNRLMTHVVAGYPSLDATKRILQGMVDAHVEAIEIQIPFSDPIADGPVLLSANDHAIAEGVGVDETFELIESIDFKQTKCIIMTYLQPILYYGYDAFFAKAESLHVDGYIIPDLPFDAPEVSEITQVFSGFTNKNIPVLSVGMSDERISALFDVFQPSTVYVTARHGITGEHTESLPGTLDGFVQNIRAQSNADIAIGFGIQTAEDVKSVLEIGDTAIVGSAITKSLQYSENAALELVTELANASGILDK